MVSELNLSKMDTNSDLKSRTQTPITPKTLMKRRINSKEKVFENGLTSKMSGYVIVNNHQNNQQTSHSLSSNKSRISSLPTYKSTHSNNISKVAIPKSKTFIRDATANTTAGNIKTGLMALTSASQSQPQSQTSLQTTHATHTTHTRVTTATPLQIASKPTPQRTSRLALSQTAIKGVPSITDKKTIPRRTTAVITTAVSNSLSQSKRVPTCKPSSYIAKKDTRFAQIVDEKKQIQKLTELCEHKTKQLKAQSLNENYLKLAFDSLSVVIRHLTEQYGAFENPELRQSLKNANKRCEQLKDSLEIAKSELNDMKIIYEEQINQLMKEREKYFCDLNQAKVNHESYVRKLMEMHSWEKSTIEDKHKKEMQLCQQTRQKMFNDIEVKNNEIEETKQLKELLEVKVHKLEENIMKDKDKKCKYLTDKIKQLDLEVDSLRAVMDMKNEKIHKLEAEMTETKDVMTELPMAKETIRGLQQQIENLKLTLERKISQFNQLVREHEDLKNEFDREMREKRRLSMKNEELQYHLSESFNEFSYMGSNYDMTPIGSLPVKKLHTEDTPIRPSNRSFANMPHMPHLPHSTSHSINKNHMKPMSASINSTFKRGMTPNFYGTNAISDKGFDNCYLTDGIADDNVFEASVSKCSSPKDHNYTKDSNRKTTAVSYKYAKSVETHTPPSILDSGFEEFQGLSSLSNNK